jgi:hypothetical protein
MGIDERRFYDIIRRIFGGYLFYMIEM